MAIINFPILYFPDPNKGRPLFNGQIFVGEPDLDPEIPANQKIVSFVQEDGTKVPTTQPIVLSAGGVPVYNGSPVRLDVDGNYSIKVLSRAPIGEQVYYIENVFEGTPILIEDLPQYVAAEFATIADAVAGNSQNLGSVDFSDYIGREVATKYYDLTSKDGGAIYIVKAAAESGDTVDNQFYGFDTNDGNVLILKEGLVGAHNLAQGGSDPNVSFNAIQANASAGDRLIIPSGQYVASNWEVSKLEISGVGSSTILESDTLNPVIVPLRHIDPPLHDWDYMAISDMTIDGIDFVQNGIQHDLTVPGGEFAGRWNLKNIALKRCNKAIQQSKGQIGGRYEDITIRTSDFGFWIQDERQGGLMHSGNKMWEQVHIDQTSLAGIYIKDITDGSGQHVFNNVILEQNDGYGIFINGLGGPFTPVSFPVLNQLWFETNGKTNAPIDIDGYVNIPNDGTFRDVKGVVFNQMYCKDLRFEGTTGIMNAPRMDSSNGAYSMELDDNSALIIRDFHGNDTATVKEYIQNYAHAVNWAAGGRNNGAQYMPHRTVKTYNGYGLQASEPFNSGGLYAWTGSGAKNSIPVRDGITSDSCTELVVTAGATHLAPASARAQIIADKWNVVTAAFKVVDGVPGNLVLYFWAGGADRINLTNAINDRRKLGQWYTSVALVPCFGRAGSPNLSLWAEANNSDVTTRFGDMQSMAFDTKQDALIYIENREYTTFDDGGANVNFTTAVLSTATQGVNIGGKFAGRQVFNTTTNQTLYAAGPLATDVWVDSAGVTVITPV